MTHALDSHNRTYLQNKNPNKQDTGIEVKEHTTKTYSMARTTVRVSGAASEGNMARAVRKPIDFPAPVESQWLLFQYPLVKEAPFIWDLDDPV